MSVKRADTIRVCQRMNCSPLFPFPGCSFLSLVYIEVRGGGGRCRDMRRWRDNGLFRVVVAEGERGGGI